MNILDILIWGGGVTAIGIVIGWGIYSMQAGERAMSELLIGALILLAILMCIPFVKFVMRG